MQLPVIFQFISTTAVILCILFGILNLRNFQKTRKRETALLMLNSFQTTEFMRGLLLIFDLADGVGMAKIKKLPKEDYLAFHMLLGTWERLGILVYSHEIPMDLVDDAFSGPILISWNKLETFISQFRAEDGRETHFEWFQWLAEQMIKREAKGAAIPAYVTYKNWKAK